MRMEKDNIAYDDISLNSTILKLFMFKALGNGPLKLLFGGIIYYRPRPILYLNFFLLSRKAICFTYSPYIAPVYKMTIYDSTS